VLMAWSVNGMESLVDIQRVVSILSFLHGGLHLGVE